MSMLIIAYYFKAFYRYRNTVTGHGFGDIYMVIQNYRIKLPAVIHCFKTRHWNIGTHV